MSAKAYPRPPDRGLIEAEDEIFNGSGSGAIRGLRTAASLKRSRTRSTAFGSKLSAASGPRPH